MCGIAGFVNFHKDISKEIDTLENMVSTLINRGPNSSGYYHSTNVLFGHRRLIVVDPKGGVQPMSKILDGNEYTLIYNGELYNTEDIRKELISNGFKFTSYSDTEVLLTSYIHWGVDCINKFNGIFAFAIYDKKNNHVFLGRDPLGVKPLFYSIIDNTLIFSSEIKTILAHPYVNAEVNTDGLTELFSLGPAISPGSSIYKNIKEIPPGNHLIFTPNNLSITEYWRLEAVENLESTEEIIEHTRELLIDAIKRQLVGDVPLCTFLSGGLDSSAISAIASKEFNSNNKILTTYSIDYEYNDKYFKSSLFQPTSDQYWALVMSDYLKTDHKTVTLKHEDLVSSLKDSVIARDLPGMADIDSSLYLFCKEVKKDFVIALSGECADEIFGGYPWYTNNEMKYSDTFPWSRFVEDRKLILNNDLSSLKIEEFANEQYSSTLSKVPHINGESKEEHRMRELFYLNIKWFMVTLLNRKDRMSMANSLEVRVPFADPRLVQYAFNIPGEIKLLNGREKGLLRKSLEGLLPEEIIYRKKSPYPKTHNPIYTELVCAQMQDIINNSNSPILPLINKKKIQEIINTKGASYSTPWYGQLMAGPQLIAYLIQVNTWLKEYKISIV